MKPWIPTLAFVILGTLTAWSCAAEPSRDGADSEHFFETRIRPVLVNHCMSCHGVDKQWSGLRLDSRDAALKGGDYGPAVVPGDPESSLLIDAVTHLDDFLKMPPKADKLPDEVIQDLTAWVRAGAPWPDATITQSSGSDNETSRHWAFEPVRKVEPPAVADPAWVATPVDAFVLSELQEHGLTPSAEADRRTLLRRVTFDLTGLPPTPEEIAAFLRDDSPEAYDRVVDRLLASPQYGERWGRHWLDVARYADTKGYVFQEERRYPYAYTYRDYVIDAFNQDKPYDQFIREQLAADLLPDDGDHAKLAALGFLTVGRRFLNKQDDIIDDRIDVTSRGLLGLTVACARCHDHKYDPIPAEDYYSLYGVFASSEEPQELPLLATEGEAALGSESYRQENQKLTGEVAAYVEGKRQEYRQELTDRLPEYLEAVVLLDLDPGNGQLDTVAREKNLRPELLRHAIQQWKALVEAAKSVGDSSLELWTTFASVPREEGLSEKFAAIFQTLRAELEDGDLDPARRVVIETLIADPAPTTLAEVAKRYGELLKTSISETERSELAALRARLESGESPLTIPEDAGSLRRLFNRADRDRYTAIVRKVAALDASHPGAPPRAMVLVDRAQPVDPYVFLRGNPGRRGESIPRRFLKVLSGPERTPFGEGSGRLKLAEQIASPENPLTARVFVNRVWTQHFGKPLVSTPSDFGLRSDPPTHPELLDWLAATFVEEGWSVKTLHRLMVLSNTYRQQSLDRPDCQAVDPENALLWKQNRQRLELEPLRDAMLAVSGRLDPTMGGRAVEITEPPFSNRRTIYAFIDRQNLPGLFRTFDLASPDSSSPQRYETTVPQQALFLMNSQFVAEQARSLIERLDQQGDLSPEQRVATLHQWLFGRDAEPRELDVARRFLEAWASTGDTHESVLPWQYGYGRFDESSGQVASFQAFPHWTGQSWQFGDKIPHPEFSYLHLNAGGGHAGKNQEQAAVLRWVAPAVCVVSVRGGLGHESEKGDGVRGRIVAGHSGLAGDWIAHNAQTPTRVERLELAAGETLDFVVDCRTEQSFDTYTWNPAIRLIESSEKTMATSWTAKDDFQGPPAPRLSVWEQYAQVLYLTNEFAFVD